MSPFLLTSLISYIVDTNSDVDNQGSFKVIDYCDLKIEKLAYF